MAKDHLDEQPIVIDLDGDGIELTNLDQSTAFFDIDGDGFIENTGWAAADFQVMDPTGRGPGNTDDAALFGYCNFSFDGVTFLLAGIPAPLLAAWSLNWLFRAVDNQGFGFLAADPDRMLDPKNPHGEIFDPPQGSADGSLVHSIQTAHEVLCDGATVQNQQNQQMIFELADAPWPARAVLLDYDPFSPMRPQAINQLAERVYLNTRQGPKLLLADEPCDVKLCQRKGLPCSSFFESHAG